MINLDQNGTPEEMPKNNVISEGTINELIDQTKDNLGDITDRGYKHIKSGAQKANTATGKVNSALTPTADQRKDINQIRGVLDTAREVHTVDNRSIVARAKNSVMQFPVYISSGINVNAAHTLSKAFDRVYATFVQTVLSQNPDIYSDELNDMKFLRQFHVNLKESYYDEFQGRVFNEYYQPIDEFDTLMQESLRNTLDITENMSIHFRHIPTDNDFLIAENARMANEPLTGFSYLNEQTNIRRPLHSTGDTGTEETEVIPDRILGDEQIEDIGEARWKAKEAEINNVIQKYANKEDLDETEQKELRRYEKQKERMGRYVTDNEINYYDYAINEIEQGRLTEVRLEKNGPVLRLAARKTKEKATDDNGIIKKDENGKDIEVKKTEIFIPGNHKKRTKPARDKQLETVKNRTLDAPRLLREHDIKKINGMNPYTIEAMFRVVRRGDKNNEEADQKEVRFVLGVKTILHLISAKDLSSELRELIMGDVKALQKVRYKTGEISWLKDYVLNLPSLRSDASKNLDPRKKWMNTLKRLSDYTKQHGGLLKKGVQAITGGYVPIPNGTLILSQLDVSRLTNETGIDLGIVSNAKALSKSLFLISIAIVDQTKGSLKVLFPDSDTDWDIQSLASIDADVAKAENSQLMKELNKVVSR